MATQFARQTAIPCTLAEIRSGAWIQNDGITPSGVRTPRGMISRISAIGVIVDKQGDASFSLDDGTTIINVRSFDTKPLAVRASVGDIVMVIGRPREYNGERYIVLEICKKLKNHAWTEYRKRELEAFARRQAAQQPAPVLAAVTQHTVAVETEQSNPFEVLVAKVRELDTGNGADIEEVLTAIALPESGKLLKALLEEGELFEIRPGKVKVLE